MALLPVTSLNKEREFFPHTGYKKLRLIPLRRNISNNILVILRIPFIFLNFIHLYLNYAATLATKIKSLLIFISKKCPRRFILEAESHH